jgi:hypothetical protein
MTPQPLAPTTAQPVTPGAEISEREEAARYALLQRLTPALQHHLMGDFQFMGMVAALMERRFQAPEPDLASIHQDCVSLGSVSRTVVSSITDLMTWIEPKTEPSLQLVDGVKACLGLLTTTLRFRGFVVVNEVPVIDMTVSSRALRSVLSAALLALSDASTAPAILTIKAQTMPDGVGLSIEARPTEGKAGNVNMTSYRPLTWRDVESLATADGVKLLHGNSGVKMVFSPVGTPVQSLAPAQVHL